ncbi:MAG: hypothetical protein HYZ38_17570 [Mycobacterium sp.]|nr:hypothetical protein [Mycobacterium sp.]
MAPSTAPGAGVEHLDDSAPKNGQRFAVPLDMFIDAWRTGDFTPTTAQLAAVNSSSSLVAAS